MLPFIASTLTMHLLNTSHYGLHVTHHQMNPPPLPLHRSCGSSPKTSVVASTLCSVERRVWITVVLLESGSSCSLTRCLTPCTAYLSMPEETITHYRLTLRRGLILSIFSISSLWEELLPWWEESVLDVYGVTRVTVYRVSNARLIDCESHKPDCVSNYCELHAHAHALFAFLLMRKFAIRIERTSHSKRNLPSATWK